MALTSVPRTRRVLVLCAAIASLPLLSACGHAATGSFTPAVEDEATIAGRSTTSTIQIEDWEGLSRGPYSVGIGHASGGNPIVRTCPGVREIVPFTIGNYGELADSYEIEVTSSSPLIDVTGVPATLALDPGETYELRLGLEVPFDLEDGPLGEVEIAVTSLNSSDNVSRRTATVEIEKPTIGDSVALLDVLSTSLRFCAEQNPLASNKLTSAAEDAEVAGAVLARSPTDRVMAVNRVHDAVVSLWQAIDALVRADAQSGTSTNTERVEVWKDCSTLLVTVLENEAQQAIGEAEAAGEDPEALLAARTNLDAGHAAFTHGDHVEAAARYADAANVVATSPKAAR